jgi:hypothetical protein
MNATDESRWLAQLRSQLDEDARGLDAATASRLNRARQHALDVGLARRRSRYGYLAFALTAGIAAVLALSVLVRAPEQAESMPALAAPSNTDDLELLAGTEELEMIENLEFYAWLELQSLDG